MTLPRLLSLLLVLIFGGAVAAHAQAVPQSRQQIEMSFSPVVKQVAPAVVNIYTKRVVHQTSPLLADPFFRQFFGQGLGLSQDRVERSLGSGVLIRADGLVVTNNHVIQGAQQITVVLSDRREFEARVVGSDSKTDLAVLKINAGHERLPVLPLGDSDALEVGDLVLDVGNPFGVGQTVTMGIVSALARTGVGLSDYRSFIQTDAAINPGNSGGALVDMRGRLVGINSEIYSKSGGSVGIGFAIPVNMVKVVVAAINHGGKTVRPWLGAGGQSVTGEMFQALGLDHPQGVLINSVEDGGPAARAGLAVGDVITAVDGKAVDDPEALRFRIAMLPVGGQAGLTVLRHGRTLALTVRLAPPPEIPPRDTTSLGGRTPFTGAVAANMNPALADELGLASYQAGVILLRIQSGSIADQLGFRPGDMVVRVNHQEIASVAGLRAILQAGAVRWMVSVRRDGQILSMTIGG